MDRRDFIAVAGVGTAAFLMPGVTRAAAPLTEDEIEAKVKEILPQLGLWEKVSLMSGRYTADFIEKQKGYGKSAPFRTPGLPRFGIPGIRFIDGPRGINFEGSTCFPCAMARGATWDAELCERVGDAMGYEARAQGANYWGGLCINVLRHPAGGRAQETYGEDPHHIGKLAVAMMNGVQRHVMACAKHYACNNNEDSRFYVNVKVGERTLREIYLPHFKACVDAGVASVMSAYNFVNGQHCGENKHLLREVLKDDWGFKGFVVSDFTMGVHSTVAAAKNGQDVEMPGTIYFGRKLLLAVKMGLVPEAAIDESVSRILREQLRFLHLETASYYRAKVAGPEHQELCREVAQRSIVLLKNQDKLLPLDPASIKKLAVLGRLADQPNTGDHGSSAVRPPYVVTPLQGIREKFSGAQIITAPHKDLEAVRDAAQNADAVIIVAGLDYQDEGEGGAPTVPGDREFLGLHDDDIALIKAAAQTNKKIIVVLEGGSAITMPEWKDEAQAILMAWYPGMEGGRAIANVLAGSANPSGRIPFVWPKDASQCAPFKNWARTLDYGPYHGYRLADKMNFEPEFPFGFGLSYISVFYSELKLSDTAIPPDGKITVSVNVENSGEEFSTDEVVQVYIGSPNSKVDRAPRELKAFANVNLSPTERMTVSLDIPAADLAYYDEATKSWKVEPGEYKVYVGPWNREKDLLTASFTISS